LTLSKPPASTPVLAASPAGPSGAPAPGAVVSAAAAPAGSSALPSAGKNGAKGDAPELGGQALGLHAAAGEAAVGEAAAVEGAVGEAAVGEAPAEAPPAPPPPSRAQRAARVGAALVTELVPLILLIMLLSLSWSRGLPVKGVELAPPPWWGSPRDLLLDGPDAGEWARNATLLFEHKLDQLDHHRLPGWLLLLAALMQVEPSVPLAGHFGNRLMFALMGLSLYGIGRLSGSRSAGLLAACLALTAEPLVLSGQRFGVDIVVSGCLSLSFLLTLAAARWWWLAPVAGALVGYSTGLHYTTLPYALPMLILLLFRAGPGPLRGFAATVGWLLGGGLVIYGLLQIYPVPQTSRFLEDIANGISPGSRGQGSVGSVQDSMDRLRAGLEAGSAKRAVQIATAELDLPRLSRAWPDAPAVAAWLGLTGLGLGLARPRTPAKAHLLPSRFGWLTDLSVGVPLLLCLGPLPFLAAVNAPVRYGANLLPFVALLLARGLLSPVALVERLLQAISVKLALRFPAVDRVAPSWLKLRWPVGLLTFGVALFGMHEAHEARGRLWRAYPLSDDEVGTALLAEALKANFPAGSAVACPVRESVLMAGLRYCPERVCPVVANERMYNQCLVVLGEECGDVGDIGYIATSAQHFYDPNATARPAMDAWVAERWPAVRTVSWKKFQATIHVIPRDVLPAEGEVPAWGSSGGSP
jgi:hypothetical protein